MLGTTRVAHLGEEHVDSQVVQRYRTRGAPFPIHKAPRMHKNRSKNRTWYQAIRHVCAKARLRNLDFILQTLSLSGVSMVIFAKNFAIYPFFSFEKRWPVVAFFFSQLVTENPSREVATKDHSSSNPRKGEPPRPKKQKWTWWTLRASQLLRTPELWATFPSWIQKRHSKAAHHRDIWSSQVQAQPKAPTLANQLRPRSDFEPLLIRFRARFS